MIWHGHSFLLGPNLIFTAATMAVLSRISFQVWPFTSIFKTAMMPAQINSSQRLQKESQVSPTEVGGLIKPLRAVLGVKFMPARRHGNILRCGINFVACRSRDGAPTRRRRSDWRFL